MAFPIGTPTTTTSGLQTSFDKYFDKLLISTLDPATRFYQFGQKRPLPQGAGNIAVWNRVTRLGIAFTLSEGSPISASKQLSSTNVSATIMQFGRQAIAELKSFLNIKELLFDYIPAMVI